MASEDAPPLVRCGEDLEFSGAYSNVGWKTAIYHLLGISTLGLFYLLGHWWPTGRISVKYDPADPSTADFLVLQERNGEFEEIGIEVKALPGLGMVVGMGKQSKLFKVITFRNQGYFLAGKTFEPVKFLVNFTYSEFHEKLSHGILSKHELTARRGFYNYNEIIIPQPSCFSLLFHDLLRPFVFFQLACILMWYLDSYELYATVILVMIAGSIGNGIREKKVTSAKLGELAESEAFAYVLRDGDEEKRQIPGRELVPGDVILLTSSSQVPCDCVILSGSCIVNESILTGQQVPTLKTPLPNNLEDVYEMDKDRKYTLFGGTIILSTRGEVRAVVIATGYDTVKGQILKAMIHSSDSKFKFYGQAIKFVWVFASICAIATLIALFSFKNTTASPRDILFRSLDLISIGIPPALPLTLSLGIEFAVRRLKKKGIVCLSPMEIIAAGKTTVVCFDKTGTLTENTMQFAGTWGGSMHVPTQSISDRLALCLSCCNSLTFHLHAPLGAPEDLCLHAQIKYSISEEGEKRVVNVQGREAKIERIYHFSSSVKRMGVIARMAGSGELTLFLKGAPEELRPLFLSLPKDYSEMVSHFTREGFRVLACGSKSLPDSTPLSTPLSDIQSEIHFIGLVLLKNNIKPEAFAMVGKLMEVGYRIIMSTGDNVRTGVSVAEELKMIPQDYDIYLGETRKTRDTVIWEKVRGEGSAYQADSSRAIWYDRIRHNDTKFALAVSGKAFLLLVEAYKNSNRRLLRFIVSQIYVCGRMSPIHKIQLIEELKRLGLIVAMVGDSASDSGSIKAADVGLCVSHLSLSLAAPFTGSSVLSLENILREGKATLAASFQCFKFMGLYSMVQLMSVLTLYMLKTNFSTLEFLYVDLFTVIPLTFVMGITKAYPVLTDRQPPGSVFSMSVATSIAGQCLIQLLFIGLTYYSLLLQDWYIPQGKGLHDPIPIIENTVFFLLSNFQYLTACLVYSVGPPFRVPLYTNCWFSVTVMVLFALNCYLVLSPHSQVLGYMGVSNMQMVALPVAFRKILSLCVAANVVCAFTFEHFLSSRASRGLKREYELMQFQEQNLRKSITY